MSTPPLGQKGTPAIVFADSGQYSGKPPAKGKPNVLPTDMEQADTNLIDAGELTRAESQLTRRQEKVGHPGKLSGSDAETFVEKKMVELSVDAVIELEYAVKYGTSGERERARDRILDANGHGKRDKAGGGANLIIVHMGGNGSPQVVLPPMLQPPLLTSGK